jgi:hypothetical protein
MRKGKPDLAPLLELHPIESENSRVLIRLSGNNMKTKGKQNKRGNQQKIEVENINSNENDFPDITGCVDT